MMMFRSAHDECRQKVHGMTPGDISAPCHGISPVGRLPRASIVEAHTDGSSDGRTAVCRIEQLLGRRSKKNVLPDPPLRKQTHTASRRRTWQI